MRENQHAYRILVSNLLAKCSLSKQTTKHEGNVNIDLLAIYSENGR
jgi:hypothetical protein